MDYKAIKIPQPTYEAVKRAQMELVKNGINSIPQEITKNCPFCKTTLSSVEVGYSYAECPKCTYQQQQFNLNAGGRFALGIVIVLGVAALISMLTERG